MIKIKSDQEKQLSFDLEISGSPNTPEVRLVMEAKGLNLMFPANLSNGTAKVVIPELSPLLDLFEGNKATLKLETIIDGNHSVIWEENSVEIEVPVKVTTTKPIVEDAEKSKGIKVVKIQEEDSPIEIKKTIVEDKPAKKSAGKTSLKDMFLED